MCCCLVAALIQDIWQRQVQHSITLLMLIISILNALQQTQTIQFYSYVFAVLIGSLGLWYFNIWGASDSKWLTMNLSWLPLKAWPDVCFLFSVILFIQIIFNKHRQKNLALLVPINTASLILILFYK